MSEQDQRPEQGGQSGSGQPEPPHHEQPGYGSASGYGQQPGYGSASGAGGYSPPPPGSGYGQPSAPGAPPPPPTAPGYGQAPYGDAAYGQTSYGQNQYAGAPYAQAPYGQSAPGQAYPGAAGAYGYAQQPPGDPGTLDLPWYGIGFLDAIKRGFAKAFRYDGRASRGEFWFFYLFVVIVLLVLYAIFIPVLITASQSMTSSSSSPPAAFGVFGLLFSLAGLGLGLVSLSAAVRRLHDAGYSGWMYLLSLIPLGGIVVLVFLVGESKPEGQRFDRTGY
jgi:uncharacterized membrane protein YhaH (DUF805 family)